MVIDARSEPIAGLGHRDGRDQLARADAGQPALLLLVVREVQEVRQADVVVQRRARARRPSTPARWISSAMIDVEAEVARRRRRRTPRGPPCRGTRRRRRRRTARGRRCRPAPTVRRCGTTSCSRNERTAERNWSWVSSNSVRRIDCERRTRRATGRWGPSCRGSRTARGPAGGRRRPGSPPRSWAARIDEVAAVGRRRRRRTT